jgi:sulfonate transport system substrate-binding protein
MPLDRRQIVAGATTLAAAGIAPRVFAQAPEKTKITLGVGGKNLLYYLPLTIAERKGYFKDFGLDVTINDFAGGSRSLQALIGGSVDAVAGAYEHTLRMQAKGQDIRAVIELLRFPSIVVAVRKSLAGKIKSAANFKGLKIGVTAPGSSTYITVLLAMSKAGLKASDASFIGIGGGASGVAAMKQGQIDVISHLDPVIAKLEADGDVVTLIDTRTEAGTRALFGGSNPASCIYAKNDFIRSNPNTVQAIVNAHYKALQWIAKATPAEVADVVPPNYLLNDRPLYEAAFKKTREAYSVTGLMSADGMASVASMLKALDANMASAKVDVSASFDHRFVDKAASTVKL